MCPELRQWEMRESHMQGFGDYIKDLDLIISQCEGLNRGINCTLTPSLILSNLMTSNNSYILMISKYITQTSALNSRLLILLPAQLSTWIINRYLNYNMYKLLAYSLPHTFCSHSQMATPSFWLLHSLTPVFLLHPCLTGQEVLLVLLPVSFPCFWPPLLSLCSIGTSVAVKSLVTT